MYCGLSSIKSTTDVCLAWQTTLEVDAPTHGSFKVDGRAIASLYEPIASHSVQQQMS